MRTSKNGGPLNKAAGQLFEESTRRVRFMSDVKRSTGKVRVQVWHGAFAMSKVIASPSAGTRSARLARPDAGDREVKMPDGNGGEETGQYGYFGPAKNERTDRSRRRQAGRGLAPK